MKKIISNKRAFTLIELLVVVLIIGILAAIAVPQYQKAVVKAQVVQELAIFNAYKKAIDVWILENGWPTQAYYFTGTKANAGLDIEFFSNKSSYAEKQGDLYVEAYITPTYAFIDSFYYNKGKFHDGAKACHSIFQRQEGANEWNFAAVNYKSQNSNATADQCPDYQRMMCEYWGREGTGLGRNPSIEQCARFGITLTKSGT